MNAKITQPQLAFARSTSSDTAPNTDPGSSFWRDALAVIATNDNHGNTVPGHRTEIYARWSLTSLYFLFVCPFQTLHLKPFPGTSTKTHELWNWDVAEAFIGCDFDRIARYKEFEVSPQSEWLDVAVDLERADDVKEWMWHSGVEVAARIEAQEQCWYGFMRIPYSSVDSRPPAPGNQLRVNFFRSQGPPAANREVSWQPTYEATFHVPRSFGILELSPSE